MRIALRTQQIIAHETGVTNTIDPLGGSYFVEALTDRMEAQAYDYFAQDRRARRHGRGGQAGLPAARDRRRRLRAADGDRRAASGSSSASTTSPRATTARSEILHIDPALERKQIDRVQGVRARRDGAAVEARAGRAARRRRPTEAQPDAAAARLRARARHARARSSPRCRTCGAPTPRPRSSDRPRRASPDPHELDARPAVAARRGRARARRSPASRCHVTRPGTRVAQPRLDRVAAGAAGSLSRPACRSSTSCATVSVAHFLFVPITPDGPRLIQPTAYSPGAACRPPRRRGRRRCGSGRGARRTGRRAAGARGSRSSGSRGRRG